MKDQTYKGRVIITPSAKWDAKFKMVSLACKSAAICMTNLYKDLELGLGLGGGVTLTEKTPLCKACFAVDFPSVVRAG